MSVSNGRSLPLSVSELPSYSLFPGQTVVVKAQNEDGRRLKAVKCYAELVLLYFMRVARATAHNTDS
ncbi:hypothetical protein EB796_004409 [Bugula neritina]|uniref:DNA polymerase alpha subunit B OB domain-containing protein n=1 Tax=Bugula neritina TaxID=10212 RepID=A0A7J7KGB8_BUGNE|nr:hypothetical protein EB796_004409 [Bugula neritina]